MSEPHRMRLRNGITTINRITGETAPTYGEYVLATDYDAALEKIEALKRAIKRMTSEHISSPKLKYHLWARDCDACNAQKIGETALAAVEGEPEVAPNANEKP